MSEPPAPPPLSRVPETFRNPYQRIHFVSGEHVDVARTDPSRLRLMIGTETVITFKSDDNDKNPIEVNMKWITYVEER